MTTIVDHDDNLISARVDNGIDVEEGTFKADEEVCFNMTVHDLSENTQNGILAENGILDLTTSKLDKVNRDDNLILKRVDNEGNVERKFEAEEEVFLDMTIDDISENAQNKILAEAGILNLTACQLDKIQTTVFHIVPMPSYLERISLNNKFLDSRKFRPHISHQGSKNYVFFLSVRSTIHSKCLPKNSGNGIENRRTALNN